MNTTAKMFKDRLINKYLSKFTSLDKGTQPFVVCDG